MDEHVRSHHVSWLFRPFHQSVNTRIQTFVGTALFSRAEREGMTPVRTLRDRLVEERRPQVSLDSQPTKAEVREAVLGYKEQGLCGRRVAEEHLGPYFIASDVHGERELELLEEILEEEYGNTNLCIRERQSECSRLRGGCRNWQWR